MNLRLATLCLTVAGLMPVAAMGQTYIGDEAHVSASVIRPVGYGPLWDDYDGGCGHRHGHGHRHGLGHRKHCCGPVGCPYGVGASCGCGGCNDGCNYRIACGLPLALNRVTRSLDCLFPCRPKLLGCGSGWGGCSPCYDPSCGGGCPKPHFGKRFGLFGGCAKCDHSTNCNLDCSCGTPAATFGPPHDIHAPVPTPESTIDPFMDDTLPEPVPTDARRNSNGRSHFSNGPTPARRPLHHQASLEREATGRNVTTKAPPTVSRVLPADHTAPHEGSAVRQVSAQSDSDDVIRNYTQARRLALQTQSEQGSEALPHNPLR